jgi:hypothetical protein
LGERGSGLASFEELWLLPRELERLPTNCIFLSGIFLVAFFGGDFEGSSDGDDRLVDKKLRSWFFLFGNTIWFGERSLLPKKEG